MASGEGSRRGDKACCIAMTRTELVESLPRSVTGVESVTAYPYYDAKARFKIEQLESAVAPPPAMSLRGSGTHILYRWKRRRAGSFVTRSTCSPIIDLTSQRKYRRRRSSCWSWQREF